MSNQEHPCSGHIIEAVKLAVLLPDDRRQAFNNALANHDFETATNLLDQFVPNDVVCPSSIFVLTDTDTGDPDLEEDVPYAYFDEDDLFVKQEKPELIQLREKIGQAPTAHSWTIWG